MFVGNNTQENVHSFEYSWVKLLGPISCYGDDQAGVLHRVAIVETTVGYFYFVQQLDRPPSVLRLETVKTYQLEVCTALTHSSEATL